MTCAPVPIDLKDSFVATGEGGELLLAVTFGEARADHLLIAGTNSLTSGLRALRRMDRRRLVWWCHTAPDHPPACQLRRPP